MAKNSLFNRCYWENCIITCRKIKLDSYLTQITNINLKWIKDLTVRTENMKLWVKIIQGKLLVISIGNDFLDMIPEAKATKQKINKWDYIKLKSFCSAKEAINKMKRQPTEWESHIFVMLILNVFISKIYKELIQINYKKTQKIWLKIGRGSK